MSGPADAEPVFAEQLGSDDPLERARAALDLALYYLDRGFAPAGKTRAFLKARDIVGEIGSEDLRSRVAAGTLTDLAGIGPSTGSVISDAVDRRPSRYLADLASATVQDVGSGGGIRSLLRGDLHSHTFWSDGSESVATMARSARALGHEYLAVTDHSARLTVAHGLDEARLGEQHTEIEALNAELAPFRILTGMEVDILEDGRLDLSSEMLSRLDVVVASVTDHKLTVLRDVMLETEQYGFDKVCAEQHELGRRVRALLESRGFPSVAAEGFQAPGVVVSYTSDPEIQTGKKFLGVGLQTAAGVPLQCDEGADFRTFRIGLFGLDKLHDPARTVESLAEGLDKVLG